jgi:glucose-6-phosphate 1-epimerase
MSTNATPSELQQRFGKSGAVKFVAGQGGLTCAEITAAAGAAHIYLHGAHMTHFQPKGQAPILWMSASSPFTTGKGIRGGVPVIIPWFGAKADDKTAPQHGFARSVAWNFEGVEERGSSVAVTLSLRPDPEQRKWWPQDFEARYTVSVGSSLEMTLQMRNTSPAAFVFGEALHTYFAVADVRNIRIDGLDGVTYADKVQDFKRFTQKGPITFTGETDRVYLNTTATCTIHDPGMGRRILVEKINSASTVVWNPWAEKSKAMLDLGADAWIGMLCVETCNVADNAIALPAGKMHEMKAILRSENI